MSRLYHFDQVNCIEPPPNVQKFKATDLALPSAATLNYDSLLSYADPFRDTQWIVLTAPYNLSSAQMLSISEQLAEAPPPQKRYAHSACTIGNQMFVFGGLNSPSRGGNL